MQDLTNHLYSLLFVKYFAVIEMLWEFPRTHAFKPFIECYVEMP